jgi:hypothetical protein
MEGRQRGSLAPSKLTARTSSARARETPPAFGSLGWDLPSGIWCLQPPSPTPDARSLARFGLRWSWSPHLQLSTILLAPLFFLVSALFRTFPLTICDEALARIASHHTLAELKRQGAGEWGRNVPEQGMPAMRLPCMAWSLPQEQAAPLAIFGMLLESSASRGGSQSRSRPDSRSLSSRCASVLARRLDVS